MAKNEEEITIIFSRSEVSDLICAIHNRLTDLMGAFLDNPTINIIRDNIESQMDLYQKLNKLSEL